MDQAIEEVSERDSLMSRNEEPDLASLVSLEISAMDQAIEEVSERDSLTAKSEESYLASLVSL